MQFLFIMAVFPLLSLAQQIDTDLKKSFDRCAEISDEIAAIRELKFTNRVEVKVQTKEEFVEYIEKEIDNQYGSEAAVNSYVDALVLLGALPEKLDFTDTLKEMMISQAAAHYDPRGKVYYLLMTESPEFLLDIISSHELCHALQDQHFDLGKLMMDDTEAMRDNGDAATAKQCITEGDATLVMTWWAMSKQQPEASRAQLSAQVSLAAGIQASMDFDTIKTFMEQGVADAGGSFGSIAGSIEELEKYPRLFIESLIMAYTQGAVAVDRIRTQGGWKAVNELYSNPPASTEQILHPEKLIGKRDDPVDIRLNNLTENPPEGWKIAEEDVLGELGTRILFSTWKDGTETDLTPSRAAAGWDGDRYYYLTNSDKDEALVWKTTWDTEADAAEFSTALLSSLKLRYRDLKAATGQKHSGRQSYVTKDRKLLISNSGKDVLLLNTPHTIAPASLLELVDK